jgi:hypothetical protein
MYIENPLKFIFLVASNECIHDLVKLLHLHFQHQVAHLTEITLVISVAMGLNFWHSINYHSNFELPQCHLEAGSEQVQNIYDHIEKADFLASIYHEE